MHVFLFNCVRELLFNVVKHAGASRAVVVLAWIGYHLRIEVRDNGKGFSNNMPDKNVSQQDGLAQTLGLPTIRHQLSLFGGSMEIHAKTGDGTQVILLVPIEEAGADVSSPEDTL